MRADELTLQIRDDRTRFAPGEEVAGVVSWQLSGPPRAVVVRLIWLTRGKGTGDVGGGAEVRFDAPAMADRKEFRLRVPDGPYSFSGKLISLIWMLELAVEPSGEARQIELTVSPTGREILLHGSGQGGGGDLARPG